MQTPIIGIPVDREQVVGGRPRLAVNRRYVAAVEAAGGVPLLIPLAGARVVRALYEQCDGLLLPGGADVGPGLYGQATNPACRVDSCAELDAVHLPLARWAIEDGLPLLGICRGLQVINVVCGGTLWQDINTQQLTAVDHVHAERAALAHDVEVLAGSLLHRVTGAVRMPVNSTHHQAVRALGAGLRVSGTSPDGVIEALEHTGVAFCVAVQCHPEELHDSQAWAAALFRAHVEASDAPRAVRAAV